MDFESFTQFFQKYELDELDDVADVPGVYCWYAQLKIEKPDWKNPESQVYLDILTEGFKKFRATSLETSITSTFGLKWEKTLAENASKTWESHLREKMSNEVENEKQDFSTLDTLFSTIGNRQILSEAINMVDPIFSNPLYIGKAFSLKKRLAQHKAEIDRYEQLPSDDKEHAFIKGETFAERAFGAGFSIDELVVYVLDLKKLSLSLELELTSNDDLNQLTLVIEYILNRRYRPSLGRM